MFDVVDEIVVVGVNCIGIDGIVAAERIDVGSFGSSVVEVVLCGGPKIESKKSKSENDVVDVIFEVIIIGIDVRIFCFTSGIFCCTSG